MRKLLITLFFTSFISLTSIAQIYSNGTGGGAWNSPDTWTGGVIPTTEDVIIQSPDNVTIGSTENCQDLTVNTGGLLTVTSGTNLSTSRHITVNGTLTQTGGTLNAGDTDSDWFYLDAGTLNFSGGIINVAGRYKQWNSGDAFLSNAVVLNLSNAGAQSASYNSFSLTTGEFSVASGSTVQIVLKNGNDGTTVDLYYSPTTSNFDGGSIVIENATNESNIFIDSDEPIYKIESNVGSGRTFHLNANCDFSLTELTITSGSVQVDVGAEIDLTGTGTLGNNNALIIESTTDGTGSLIATGTVTGTATVQRYIANYGAQGDSKYHFLSSPVTAQAIQPNFVATSPASDVDFYSYDEVTNYWINTKDGDGNWNSGFESSFEVGKGYLVAYPTAPINKEFAGTLNAYTSGSPLVKTCTNTNSNGWNLIGNPFPSSLDWNLVDNDLGDGMDDALYYYDSEAQNYRYYIQLSGESGALGSGSQYIPAMQGFMVHAKTPGTKTVSIHNGQQTHSTQAFYKNTNTLNDLLLLKVKHNEYEDETILFFHQDATNDFDGSYDAYKLFSYSVQMPQIYSISNGLKLAINTLISLAENTDVSIGFKTQVAGTFEIVASGIESFVDSPELILEDTFLNLMHDFESLGDYVFSSEIGTYDDRFILHFGPVGINDSNIKNNQIQIYSSNYSINIINNKNLTGDINIVNLFGQVIANYELVGDSKQQINFTASTGLYIVSIKLDNGYVISEKIIIK